MSAKILNCADKNILKKIGMLGIIDIAPGGVMKKRNVKPEDFLKFELLNDIEFSPDGEHFIYTLKRVDKSENKYFTNLFLMSSDGKETSQFTYGDWNDTSPKWSPDGRWIAFLSDRSKKLNVYVIPVNGGESRKITDLNGIVINLRWMPNSKGLIFSFRRNDSKKEKKTEKKSPPLVREVNRMYFKADGSGYRPKGNFHIYTINIKSRKKKQLTKGNWDDFFPIASPDGKKIAFISNRHKDFEFNMQLSDLWTIDYSGKHLRKIKTPKGPKHTPSWSPNGKCIAYVGHNQFTDYTGSLNHYLWVVSLDKTRTTKLTGKLDKTVMNICVDDLSESFGSVTPSWTKDGKEIIFGVSSQGNHHLLCVDVKTKKVKKITEGCMQVNDFSYNRETDRIAFTYSLPTSPANISVTKKGSNKLNFRKDMNEKFLKTLRICKPESFSFKGAKGDNVEGWLLKPPNFRKNKKYPLILEVHGGPYAQYPNSYFHEFQVLAAAGYVVFYSNPHGSQGYGEKFAKSLVNNWGFPDYKDLMTAIDILSRKRSIDKKNMGVTGGSYGGFMTNWIIGHTDIFKAACSQRCVSNLISMTGTSDGGFMMSREFGGPWWKNLDNYWRMSPLKFVKRMKTPLLIIHSEGDMRTPIEQAEQLYIALKLQKREVQFLRYPEESHGLSRHGRPDRRIDRLKRIVGWFDKYLKEKK